MYKGQIILYKCELCYNKTYCIMFDNNFPPYHITCKQCGGPATKQDRLEDSEINVECCFKQQKMFIL